MDQDLFDPDEFKTRRNAGLKPGERPDLKGWRPVPPAPPIRIAGEQATSGKHEAARANGLEVWGSRFSVWD